MEENKFKINDILLKNTVVEQTWWVMSGRQNAGSFLYLRIWDMCWSQLRSSKSLWALTISKLAFSRITISRLASFFALLNSFGLNNWSFGMGAPVSASGLSSSTWLTSSVSSASKLLFRLICKDVHWLADQWSQSIQIDFNALSVRRQVMCSVLSFTNSVMFRKHILRLHQSLKSLFNLDDRRPRGMSEVQSPPEHWPRLWARNSSNLCSLSLWLLFSSQSVRLFGNGFCDSWVNKRNKSQTYSQKFIYNLVFRIILDIINKFQ